MSLLILSQAQRALLASEFCFQTAAVRQDPSHPASPCCQSPQRKSGGCLGCGVVAPAAVEFCPHRGLETQNSAARGSWMIWGRIEMNICNNPEFHGSLLVGESGVWEKLPALPQQAAVAALGCWEKALQNLPLNTFVCNHSCSNKSLVLGLVFMGFTEKLGFQEDKTLHLQLCYWILVSSRSKTLKWIT